MQNLTDRNKKHWNYPALAFCFTFGAFLVLMIIRGFAPFGDSSMLYSDAYHQYFPFFASFRRALLSGDSLQYTWDIGLGMDYIGLYAYYLASPLNLLSVLLPESFMVSYFSLLVPIKLGLASWFFAIFLKYFSGKNDISVTLFGSAYGLCAWSMAYLWNVMWLDTFALLPLVIVGMLKLLKERKFILYTLTLFLSVFTNYYIGFFTCIFVLLCFFCYQVCRCEDPKKFLVDVGLMALFSALAIAMTAMITIPAYNGLKVTSSSENAFPTEFVLNMTSQHNWKGLLEAMRKVAGNMNGGLEPSFSEGLPNLYTGVFTNVLAFLFLFSGQVKTRDKVCGIFLILFFHLSFVIRQLDYIWHGFHFTNMLPYRFTFLHSFVMLYMGYRAYLVRKDFKLWQVAAAGILAIGLVLCSDQRNDYIFLAYNGAFLLLYLFTFVYSVTHRRLAENATAEQTASWQREIQLHRKHCSLFLCLVICLELVMTLVNFGIHFGGVTTAFYPRGKEYAASMIRYMHERESDTPFYRAEVSSVQTYNDGALNNYHGITTFSSSANEKVTEYMYKLGYAAKTTFNRYAWENSSPVSNLFLGLKYMIERSGRVAENPYFDTIHSYGDVYLLENNAYLPLGFLAESELAAVDFEEPKATFDFQNTLFRAATGISENVWYHLGGEMLTITSTDADLSSITASGSCNYTADNRGGTVDYQYLVPTEGLLCIRVNQTKRNNYSIWVNGEEILSKSYSLPTTSAVCQVYPGDLVEVAFACDGGTDGRITVTGGILHESIFREGYRRLSASTLDISSFSNTHIEGTVMCDRNGLLYTSIPQNGNWKVYVDGQLTEPTLVGDVMLSVPLTEGQHSLEFVYHNRSLTTGLLISAASALVFILLCVWVYPSRNRKGKYAK